MRLMSCRYLCANDISVAAYSPCTGFYGNKTSYVPASLSSREGAREYNTKVRVIRCVMKNVTIGVIDSFHCVDVHM